MIEHKTLVDSNGNIIDWCMQVVDSQTKITSNGILVPYCNNANLIKPKWDGSQWIEGATDKEMTTWKENNKIIVEPTQDEILRAKLLKDNVATQLQLVKQQQINANLLSQIAKLTGGTK